MSKNEKYEQSVSNGVNRREFMKRSAVGAGAIVFTSVLTACGGGGSSAVGDPSTPVSSSAWSFGVMADTQWISADDGNNPNSTAISIINQVNQRFIDSKVKFVIQVGDLCDNGSNAGLDTRALYAQSLYNAGIGFFPLRGNHESSATAASEFLRVFPQTKNGLHNSTPSDVFAISNPDSGNQIPATKTGSAFTLGSGINSPNPYGSGNLNGLSYVFDYNGVRLVMLDQFTPASGTNLMDDQLAWIGASLSSRPSGSHAFVFAHKGLITENHGDVLFGASPAADPTATDTFIKTLASNNVRYYLNGHDHMHDRTLVTTTDGTSAHVTQLVCSSDSSKFYVPLGPRVPPPYNVAPYNSTNDNTYDVPAFGHTRQTALSQELNAVGYYIVTVDGANITMTYYSASAYPVLVGSEYVITTTPTLNFTKRESFGYGINGKEFIVAQGQSYTVVQDNSGTGTTAKILSGTNGNLNVDFANRPFSNLVNTGWSPVTGATASDIFSIWGLTTDMGSDDTDVYALSLSYNSSLVTSTAITNGTAGISVLNGGKWVNAVAPNNGGVKKYVAGPWKANYPLGTYGVDAATGTAWAVVNYNAAFAVAAGI